MLTVFGGEGSSKNTRSDLEFVASFTTNCRAYAQQVLLWLKNTKVNKRVLFLRSSDTSNGHRHIK